MEPVSTENTTTAGGGKTSTPSAHALQGRKLAENWDVNSPERLEEHRRAVGENTIRTRFPPEPNGYMHFGHAKSMYINFHEAFERIQAASPDPTKPLNKFVYFRYDDTNPEAERQDFFDSLARSVKWMGWEPTKVTYTSDYFPQLYNFALRLIDEGKAYVCHQSGEEIEKSRNICKAIISGVPADTLPSPESPWRNTSPAVNRKKFLDMKRGLYAEGEASLRLKMDLTHRNPNMWDFVAYRILYHAHPRTGSEWCIYPTYDFSHCIVDSLEHIDYSICTLEFENRRESYYWLLDTLDLYKPNVFEFARLDLTNTVMSKRKLKRLVVTGQVRGWNDPRMPTLEGMRRRGFSRTMINSFMREVGITRNQGTKVEAHKFFAVCARELDERCARGFAVLHPVEVEITNYPPELLPYKKLEAPVFPNAPKEGGPKRTLYFSKSLLVERDNVRIEAGDAGFYGLCPGQFVRLRYGPIIRCDSIEMSSGNKRLRVKATAFLDENDPTVAKLKPKGVLHWLGNVRGEAYLEAEFRLYDFLFKDGAPGEEGGDADDVKVDPNSEIVVKGAVEADLATVLRASKYDPSDEVLRCQFERVGFFCLDVVDGNLDANKVVLNRIVPLDAGEAPPPSSSSAAADASSGADAKGKTPADSEAMNARRLLQEQQKAAKLERLKYPPAEYFRRPGEAEKWAAFDEEGVPTRAAGAAEDLSKGAYKKLKKELERHKDEYEEFHTKKKRPARETALSPDEIMASSARISGAPGKTKPTIQTTTTVPLSSSSSSSASGNPAPPRSHKSVVASAVTLHSVLDDEVLLKAFHAFTQRYHAEETLMFWMSVEVFKHRNWKAAKFFGVEANMLGGNNNGGGGGGGATTPTNAERRPSKGSGLLSRKSSKSDIGSPSKTVNRAEENAQRALALQRKIDQAAASRIGVTLEQLYLVKEADFIFDTFIQRGAENWCCLDFKLTSEIERRLDNPAKLTRECFREAQAAAFKGMQEDLLPRFIRELMEGSLGTTPAETKTLQDHVLELTKSPTRRKTGASTMLAFAFGSLGSSSRRLSDSNKNGPSFSTSSGNAGAATGGSTSQEPSLKREASMLLRSMSTMHILSDDGGSVGALGLSRSRLSGRRSALGMAGTHLQQQGEIDPFADKPTTPRPLGSPLPLTVRNHTGPTLGASPLGTPPSSTSPPGAAHNKNSPPRVVSVASVASTAFERPASLPEAIGAVRHSNRSSAHEGRQRSLSDSAVAIHGKRNRVVALGVARGGGGFGPKVSSLAESAEDVIMLVLQGKAGGDRQSLKRGNSVMGM